LPEAPPAPAAPLAPVPAAPAVPSPAVPAPAAPLVPLPAAPLAPPLVAPAVDEVPAPPATPLPSPLEPPLPATSEPEPPSPGVGLTELFPALHPKLSAASAHAVIEIRRIFASEIAIPGLAGPSMRGGMDKLVSRRCPQKQASFSTTARF